MKKLMIITIVTLVTVLISFNFAFAVKKAPKAKTLVKDDVHFGWHAGIVSKFTEIDGEFAHLLGGYGGWTIDHSFLIGGAGYGVTNHQDDYELGYGGLYLEYINDSHELVHFTIGNLIGGGSFQPNWAYDYHGRHLYGGENDFFVMEPDMNIVFNLTQRMRLSLGGSYRWISDNNNDYYDRELDRIVDFDDKLSGFAGSITLKIGGF